MKAFITCILLLSGIASFAQNGPPTSRWQASSAANTGVEVVKDIIDNATLDSTITIYSTGRTKTTKKIVGTGSGLDPISPIATGGTPTVVNNTPTGTLSSLVITGKNLNPVISFTVIPGQTVQGPLCTITFSSTGNIWSTAPRTTFTYSGGTGIRVFSSSNTTLVLYGNNLTGTGTITLSNIQ